MNLFNFYFHKMNECLQKMSSNQALATLVLLIGCVIHLTAAARYVPKWKKQACEVPASQNEQSHYTCDDNGDVKCLPGNSFIYLFFDSDNSIQCNLLKSRMAR